MKLIVHEFFHGLDLEIEFLFECVFSYVDGQMISIPLNFTENRALFLNVVCRRSSYVKPIQIFLVPELDLFQGEPFTQMNVYIFEVAVAEILTMSFFDSLNV